MLLFIYLSFYLGEGGCHFADVYFSLKFFNSYVEVLNFSHNNEYKEWL